MAHAPPLTYSVPLTAKYSFRAELYSCPYNEAEIHQQASRWADAVVATCDPTEISPRARNRFADAYEAGILATHRAQHPLPPVWHGWVASPLLASREFRRMQESGNWIVNGEPAVPIYYRPADHVDGNELPCVGLARGVDFYPAVANFSNNRTPDFMAFNVDSTNDLRSAVLSFVDGYGLVVKQLSR
jgi:hypothetical protein